MLFFQKKNRKNALFFSSTSVYNPLRKLVSILQRSPFTLAFIFYTYEKKKKVTRIENSIVFCAQSKLNSIHSDKWIIIISFINIMCKPYWGTRIELLVQVTFFCPATGTWTFFIYFILISIFHSMSFLIIIFKNSRL